MDNVRPAAVAGMFYPEDPYDLQEEVSTYLSEARPMVRPFKGTRPPKALIVPHAGYVYSGPIAASAYSLLEEYRSRIRKVVLLGPAHRIFLKGIAVPEEEVFVTPLGEVPIDRQGLILLRDLPQVSINRNAHLKEHSLEVQIPFLQYLLEKFELLPLVVGLASPEEVDEVLERVWGGDQTLIVVSSDLSHYLRSSLARQVDRSTAESILALNPEITPEEACGAGPLNGLLLAARKKGMQAFELDLRNSGDTAGSSDQVVGYGAFALY
ncbi:MAG: AmmeMemoRadiSam system protein B [Nitrospirota bacterium]|nr:AmmeMemoRadiSam system protein B [Nitrospirota bacterium]